MSGSGNLGTSAPREQGPLGPMAASVSRDAPFERIVAASLPYEPGQSRPRDLKGDPVEPLFLLLLVLLNGFFAMSEVALLTARRPRLEKLAGDGDRGAAAALRLAEDPTSFLSAIQIGITSIAILSGVLGEDVLAEPLAARLLALGVSARLAHPVAVAAVVLLVTYVSVVAGELVPKRIGQTSPEGIARLVSRPIGSLAALGRPFVRLFGASTNLLLRVLGVNARTDSGVTEEELHAVLAGGSESGVLEPEEHEIVQNVLRLDDRPASSLMVPRGDVVWLDAAESAEETLAKVVSTDHSRYPVCRGDFREILGVAPAKKVLALALGSRLSELESHLEAPIYVPEALSGLALLQELRGKKSRLAFVVDEYGEVLGLVTLHDVLQTLAGEAAAEKGGGWATRRDDGSWLLDGGTPTPDLEALLALGGLPGGERAAYGTLAGMLLHLFGHVPKETDATVWEGWRFEVVDMDGPRIDKVLAAPRA